MIFGLQWASAVDGSRIAANKNNKHVNMTIDDLFSTKSIMSACLGFQKAQIPQIQKKHYHWVFPDQLPFLGFVYIANNSKRK